MWYEIIILIPISLSSLPPVHTQGLNDMKGRGTREEPHHVLVAQSGSMSAAKNNGTKMSKKKESDRSTEQKNHKAKKESTPSKPIEKSVPVREFVPSEKIEADKSVDFPADI